MSNPLLTWADKEYFDSCVLDQASLMTPITIKRCSAISRDSAYPDDPPTMAWITLKVLADVREAALQEVAHSGGLLITGDNIIWCQQELRGPGQGDDSVAFDPAAVADTLIIHNQEWTIVGVPLTGRMADPIIAGYQAYIRRRKGGFLSKTDPAHD